MGLESRDYYRSSSDNSSGSSFLDWIPPACRFILIATVVVFLAQIFLTRPATLEDFSARLPKHLREEFERQKKEQAAAQPDAKNVETEPSEPNEEVNHRNVPAPIPDVDLFSNGLHVSIIEQWFQLETRSVLRGQVWRLITCAFCHDRHAVFHILFNMLFLYWFGVTLEAMYGTREFLLFYLSGALLSSLAFVGLDLFTGDGLPAIGASGAVMAVLVLYATHFPREQMRIWFFFSLEIRWVVLLYLIYDLHPVLLALAGERVFTGIAHAAHLGGLAFGFVYAQRGWRLEPLYDRVTHFLRRWNISRRQRQKKFAVVTPDDTDFNVLQTRVDEILLKLHREGDASLTDNEREVLRMASQKYRGRRSGERP